MQLTERFFKKKWCCRKFDKETNRFLVNYNSVKTDDTANCLKLNSFEGSTAIGIRLANAQCKESFLTWHPIKGAFRDTNRKRSTSIKRNLQKPANCFYKFYSKFPGEFQYCEMRQI